jgi:hypothetical protein
VNKKLKVIMVALLLSVFTPIFAKAETLTDGEQATQAQKLLDQALGEKTFYKYNLAYSAISNIKDISVQNKLMGKLASLQNVIWTEDINKYMTLLNKLTKTGSGKVYDELVDQIQNTNLQDVDKTYLLDEVTGWGKKLVFTSDYSAAVDKLVTAWSHVNDNDKTALDEAVNDATKAIVNISNTYNKEYLTEQMQLIKKQIGSKDGKTQAEINSEENSKGASIGNIYLFDNISKIDDNLAKYYKNYFKNTLFYDDDPANKEDYGNFLVAIDITSEKEIKNISYHEFHESNPKLNLALSNINIGDGSNINIGDSKDKVLSTLGNPLKDVVNYNVNLLYYRYQMSNGLYEDIKIYCNANTQKVYGFEISAPTIKSIQAKTITSVKQNDKVSLPTTVKAVTDDGTELDLPVKFENTDVNTSKIGKVIFKGVTTIYGYDVEYDVLVKRKDS